MDILRKIINVEDLSKEQKDSMFFLMYNFYSNTKRETFDDDLQEKDWVLMLFEKHTQLIVGFSTQMLFSYYFNNKEIKVLFSGDTIIHRDYWGSMGLSLIFGELMIRLINKYENHELYWLLISKGVRTYKYLPAFFIEFFPVFNKKTPDDIKQLMTLLGKKKFPKLYDTKTGIVRAKKNAQFLKTDYQPKREPRKKHEIFFYKSNPNFISGDELLCITRLSINNINPFIKRMIQ